MSFDHYVALFSAIVAFLTLVIGAGGLVTVILQLRDAARQREADSLVKVFDINRELLALGFSHPQLFDILNDAEPAKVNPVWARYYLQMWLNQLSLVHFYLHRSVIGGELRENLERDLAEFMHQRNMQRHWHEYKRAYPSSFRQLVDHIIRKNPPPAASPSQAPKT